MSLGLGAEYGVNGVGEARGDTTRSTDRREQLFGPSTHSHHIDKLDLDRENGDKRWA